MSKILFPSDQAYTPSTRRFLQSLVDSQASQDDLIDQINDSIYAIQQDIHDLESATSSLSGTYYTEAEVDALLANYSLSSHTHDYSAVYAALSHNHDSSYAALSHNHDSTYSALGHTHPEYVDPAETTTTIGALINGATSKTTPVAADQFALMDSAASNVVKKLSWADLESNIYSVDNPNIINFGEANRVQLKLYDKSSYAPDAYNIALLHFDGSNGGSTFTDEMGHTFTRQGSPTTITSNKKFGTACGTFYSGNSDSISCYHSDFAFGTGDFTIEFWMYTSSGGHGNDWARIMQTGQQNSGAGGLCILCYSNLNPARIMALTTDNTHSVSTPSNTVSNNEWHHIAVTREGANLRLWVDGVYQQTRDIGTYNFSKYNFRIGGDDGNTQYYTGLIDEVRIRKGHAAYTGTGNFTPPSAAFNVGDTLVYTAEEAIGTQVDSIYNRAKSAFYWYKGGVHSDTAGQAGTGGTVQMSLNSSGNLAVTGTVAGSNLSGTNTGNETATSIGTLIQGSTGKATLADADMFAISDSAASNVLKKHTYAEHKTLLNAIYVVAAGKSGGQTINGGTAASENLTLVSTAHATKGKILLGTGAGYDNVNNRFGVGTQSPSTTIHSLSTTEQLRLSYDANNYVSHTVDSTGNVLIDAVGSVKIGDGTNQARFTTDGTLVFDGTATYFRDALGRLTSAKLTSPGGNLVLDETESAYYYKTTATTADYLWTSIQLNHDRKHGATIYPHLHWWQASSTIPNWLIQYRYQKQGAAKTTSWTSIKYTTHVFTYTSGTLNQITNFTSISPPAGDGVSDILQIRIIRDTDNTSTLFSGTDGLATDAYISDFDVHIECDTLGSASEYVK